MASARTSWTYRVKFGASLTSSVTSSIPQSSGIGVFSLVVHENDIPWALNTPSLLIANYLKLFHPKTISSIINSPWMRLVYNLYADTYPQNPCKCAHLFMSATASTATVLKSWIAFWAFPLKSHTYESRFNGESTVSTLYVEPLRHLTGNLRNFGPPFSCGPLSYPHLSPFTSEKQADCWWMLWAGCLSFDSSHFCFAQESNSWMLVMTLAPLLQKYGCVAMAAGTSPVLRWSLITQWNKVLLKMLPLFKWLNDKTNG